MADYAKHCHFDYIVESYLWVKQEQSHVSIGRKSPLVFQLTPASESTAKVDPWLSI